MKRQKLTKYQKRRWRSLVSHMKATLPTRYPVTIRIVPKICSGTFWREGKQLFIEIGCYQSFHQKEDALIHEYAHALDHADDKEDSQEHSESWGVYYAKCYQLWEYLEANWWSDDWYSWHERKDRKSMK